MRQTPEPFCHLTVKVNPRSSRNKLAITGASSVQIWTTAPPTDGRANAAVCEAVAVAADIPKSNVRVTAGQTSRNKRLAISGITLEELMRRLAG